MGKTGMLAVFILFFIHYALNRPIFCAAYFLLADILASLFSSSFIRGIG